MRIDIDGQNNAEEQQQEVNEMKLFVEWRVRSYLLIAEALLMTKEEEKALSILDTANDLLHKNPYITVQDKRKTNATNNENAELLVQISSINDLRILCATNQKKRNQQNRRSRRFWLLQALTGSKSSAIAMKVVRVVVMIAISVISMEARSRRRPKR